MNRKWILRLGLTALALLVTTDRRRAKPRPPEEPPKPEDKDSEGKKGPLPT